jgi:hypothetical protein
VPPMSLTDRPLAGSNRTASRIRAGLDVRVAAGKRAAVRSVSPANGSCWSSPRGRRLPKLNESEAVNRRLRAWLVTPVDQLERLVGLAYETHLASPIGMGEICLRTKLTGIRIPLALTPGPRGGEDTAPPCNRSTTRASGLKPSTGHVHDH